MTTDLELLQTFVDNRETGSPAFAQLVDRHLGLVYVTALRRLQGDAHLARDVAQMVFIALAQKAPALRHHRTLAGWLHTTAVYAAAKVARAERRRREREQHAHAMQDSAPHAATTDADAPWTRVAPLLDDALQSLATRDREAVLLRYFAAQDYATIATTLQVSPNTARMRVDRALEKLRRNLARRGVISTVGALGTALTSHGATAIPPFLAATVTTSALASASSVGVVASALNLMALTKVQITLAAAVLATGGSTLAWQHHSRVTLEEAAARAPAVATELARQQADLQSLAQTAADYRMQLAAAADLPRLQAELATWRARRQELEARQKVRAAVAAPRAAGTNTGVPSDEPAVALDSFPAVQHQVAVQYPEALRRAGIPGEVILSVTVDADGRVQDPKVVETTHPDLTEPAIASVSQWVFTPGRKGGRNVNTRLHLPVHFRVDDPNWF